MQGTRTIDQNLFHLPGPACASFDFSRRHEMRITIPKPKGSKSCSEFHWHDRRTTCDRLDVIQGHLIVSSSRQGLRFLPTGTYYIFRKGERTTWSSDKQEEDLVVVLTADEIVYRNRCSAILDADRFPFLTSTPLWLKILFRSRSLWPLLYH